MKMQANRYPKKTTTFSHGQLHILSAYDLFTPKCVLQLKTCAKITSHFQAPMHANASRLPALRKLEISRYPVTFAPCQAGASTLENNILFLHEPQVFDI
jgi:hypothetical protein